MGLGRGRGVQEKVESPKPGACPPPSKCRGDEQLGKFSLFEIPRLQNQNRVLSPASWFSPALRTILAELSGAA